MLTEAGRMSAAMGCGAAPVVWTLSGLFKGGALTTEADKLRLLGYKPLEHRKVILNLGRMISCETADPFDPAVFDGVREETVQAVIELTNVRNALERVMLQFSHLAKKTEQLDSRHYRVTLNYRAEDETELLIQLLSFGPVLRVLEPAELAAHMKERILRQLRHETGREQAQP